MTHQVLVGSRQVLARGRTQAGVELRDGWDRLVASDPGLVRLRHGLRAVIAVGSTIAVQLLAATALGITGPTRLLHLLLGSLVALNMSTAIRPGRRKEMAITGAYAPPAAALGAVLATVTAPRHALSLGLFVVVCGAAVWVRRFGGRWFAAGFITWQAYFFTLYLHPPLAELPGMLIAVLVSGIWVTLLLVTVLHRGPEVRLLRTVTALRARARGVVSHCLDVLRDPADPREARQLRAQLVKLSEVALLFDGQLNDGRALPSGAPPTRLRRWIVELEIACEELAQASVDLASLGEEIEYPTQRLVQQTLEVLGWGELTHAQALIAQLRTDPHRRRSVVRRLTNAADSLVSSVEEWSSGRIRQSDAGEDDAEFEPVMTLIGESLPGTTVSERRSVAWSPRTWSATSQQAVQVSAAAGLAIVAGDLISTKRFYWAVIAAFVAFTGTATVGETVRKSVARTGGTVAGLVIATLIAGVTLGHPAVALGVLLACIFFAFYLQALSYAAMIFFITLMLGELYGILNRFSDQVLLVRLAETAVGAASGILVALFVLPTSTRATLIEARRDLLTRLADLTGECAARLRGHQSQPGLLTDAMRLDEAARQVSRNSDSMVSIRGIDRNRPGRRERVQLLVVAASTARSLVPAVLDAGLDAPPALAQCCDLIAEEARRLTDVTDLGDQPPREADDPDVAARVARLLDPDESLPVVLTRRIQRLADVLALLGPRSPADR